MTQGINYKGVQMTELTSIFKSTQNMRRKMQRWEIYFFLRFDIIGPWHSVYFMCDRLEYSGHLVIYAAKNNINIRLSI